MRTLFVIFIPVILMASCVRSGKKQAGKTATDKISADKTGQKFSLGNIVDTSGNQVVPDLSSSDLTIIDFWNNDCPPCIEEMKQFPAFIKGKAAKVSIFSISLTQYWLWKPTLQEHKGTFAFLGYDIPNWKQYNLLTTDNPRFKNPISTDRLGELSSRYNINFNPAYLVVDKSGTIIARPSSAVEYLKNLPL